MAMAPKTMAILSAIFIVISAHLALAALTASPTSFTFVFPDDFEGITAEKPITLTNTNSSANATSLSFDFTPDASLADNPVAKTNFALSDVAGFNNTKTIDIEFTIPKGIPAIDEEDDNFKHETWNVGTLKIISDHSNGIGEVTIPIKVEVKNHFEFYKDKIEIEIGDAEPKNVSDGATEAIAINEDLTINVRYENSYIEDGFTFSAGNIEGTLFIEDDEIDTSEGEDNAENGEVGMLSFSFDLADYDVGDKLDVKIELKGTNNYESLHGEVFDFKIDVKEEVDEDVGDEDADGVTDDIDLCPSTPSGCIVEFDGCMIDFDGDGTEDCTGPFKKKNNNDDEATLQQNDNTKTTSKQNTNTNKQEEKTTTEPEKKPATGDQGATSFIFGLIVGAVGTALFFILTKV